MSDVAFLGLGAMGSRMAAHLIKAGHSVTVWNRTPSATEPMVRLGASAAATPRAAAATADYVLTMVRDDEASRGVWLDPATGALAGMRPSAVAIESSTVSPDWVRTLGRILAERNLAFIEAPVSGSRPQADAAQLVFLVGGEDAVFRKTEALLAHMGQPVHHVGPLGAGAVAKLATNALMGIEVTALAELFGMLQHNGADTDRILKALSTTAVWSPMLARAATSMTARAFAPQFPVDLIAKDFRYALAAAGGEASAPVTAAAHAVFRRAGERGWEKENMTVVLRLYDPDGEPTPR